MPKTRMPNTVKGNNVLINMNSRHSQEGLLQPIKPVSHLR